jgi:hypothetical protein
MVLKVSSGRERACVQPAGIKHQNHNAWQVADRQASDGAGRAAEMQEQRPASYTPCGNIVVIIVAGSQERFVQTVKAG